MKTETVNVQKDTYFLMTFLGVLAWFYRHENVKNSVKVIIIVFPDSLVLLDKWKEMLIYLVGI